MYYITPGMQTDQTLIRIFDDSQVEEDTDVEMVVFDVDFLLKFVFSLLKRNEEDCLQKLNNWPRKI